MRNIFRFKQSQNIQFLKKTLTGKIRAHCSTKRAYKCWTVFRLSYLPSSAGGTAGLSFDHRQKYVQFKHIQMVRFVDRVVAFHKFPLKKHIIWLQTKKNQQIKPNKKMWFFLIVKYIVILLNIFFDSVKQWWN